MCLVKDCLERQTFSKYKKKKPSCELESGLSMYENIAFVKVKDNSLLAPKDHLND